MTAMLSFCIVAGRAGAAEPVDYFEGDVNLAAVARFDDLPTRLFLRPEFAEPVQEKYLPDEYLQMFVRILDGDYDSEIHCQAAQSLERVARERLAPDDKFVGSLRQRLQTTDNRDVRRACAIALAATDSRQDAELLARVCLPGDTVLCAAVEPRLAAWQSDVLLSTWENRIRDPRTAGRTLTTLACRGVAALQADHLVPEVQSLAASDRTSFVVRQAAALALAELSPQEALKTAQVLAAATMADRIIAVRLLTTADTAESLDLAGRLCDDEEDSVASLAWTLLVRLDPNRLIPRLAAGQQHSDPNVRRVVVQTAGLLPTLERCDMLSEMTGDQHIGVRNDARQTLQQLAVQDEEFRSRICANAVDATAASDARWQQIEQALLTLGYLKHDAAQANCVPLLQHDRAEVFVTAAWLLHLMPQAELGEPAAREAVRKWEQLRSYSLSQAAQWACDEQIIFLCHVAASTNRTELKEFCAESFSKSVPLSPECRAASLWALGELSIDSLDDELAARFLERVHDDDPTNPEWPVVKSTSALSLGMLGSHNSIPGLREAHRKYGLTGSLANCVRTALERLGEESEPVPVPGPSPIANWPFSPSPPR